MELDEDAKPCEKHGMTEQVRVVWLDFPWHY